MMTAPTTTLPPHLTLRLGTPQDITSLVRFTGQFPVLQRRGEKDFSEILEKGFILLIEDPHARIIATASAYQASPHHWYHGPTVNSLKGVSLSYFLLLHSTVLALERMAPETVLYGEIRQDNPKLPRLLESLKQCFWEVIEEPDPFMVDRTRTKYDNHPTVYVAFNRAYTAAVLLNTPSLQAA